MSREGKGRVWVTTSIIRPYELPCVDVLQMFLEITRHWMPNEWTVTRNTCFLYFHFQHNSSFFFSFFFWHLISAKSWDWPVDLGWSIESQPATGAEWFSHIKLNCFYYDLTGFILNRARHGLFLESLTGFADRELYGICCRGHSRIFLRTWQDFLKLDITGFVFKGLDKILVLEYLTEFVVFIWDLTGWIYEDLRFFKFLTRFGFTSLGMSILLEDINRFL